MGFTGNKLFKYVFKPRIHKALGLFGINLKGVKEKEDDDNNKKPGDQTINVIVNSYNKETTSHNDNTRELFTTALVFIKQTSGALVGILIGWFVGSLKPNNRK